MKKIMIAFATIACAVIANAATCSWTITNVQTANATKLTTGHVYMFFAESATAAASQIEAIKALAGTGADSLTAAMASANWNDTKKATAAGNFSIGTAAAAGGYTLPTNQALGLSGETTYYAYAVIFDTDTITDASNYIVAQGAGTTTGATTKENASSLNTSFNLGSQSANTNWMAVGAPEPTSGLLLLLGMAGLALKRKQA